MLQPQDVLVGLKFAASPAQPIGYERLADELGIGLSSAHRSVQRLTKAGLLSPERKVNRAALLEFVLHGVRYAYYVKPGELTRGLPTAYAAPPLAGIIRSGSEIPVWPDPEGTVRGYAVTPLHKSAPEAAKRDPDLYELLALVDAVRIGRVRERKIASELLTERLKSGVKL